MDARRNLPTWSAMLTALVLIRIGQDLGTDSRLARAVHDMIAAVAALPAGEVARGRPDPLTPGRRPLPPLQNGHRNTRRRAAEQQFPHRADAVPQFPFFSHAGPAERESMADSTRVIVGFVEQPTRPMPNDRAAQFLEPEFPDVHDASGK